MTVNCKRHWRNRRKRSSHQLTDETEDSREYKKIFNISGELHCLEFSPIKQNVGELIRQEDNGYMHTCKCEATVVVNNQLNHGLVGFKALSWVLLSCSTYYRTWHLLTFDVPPRRSFVNWN